MSAVHFNEPFSFSLLAFSPSLVRPSRLTWRKVGLSDAHPQRGFDFRPILLQCGRRNEYADYRFESEVEGGMKVNLCVTDVPDSEDALGRIGSCIFVNMIA